MVERTLMSLMIEAIGSILHFNVSSFSLFLFLTYTHIYTYRYTHIQREKERENIRDTKINY